MCSETAAPMHSPAAEAARERLKEAFERNFAEGLEIGAEVALWRGDEEILRLGAGWRDARCIPSP